MKEGLFLESPKATRQASKKVARRSLAVEGADSAESRLSAVRKVLARYAPFATLAAVFGACNVARDHSMDVYAAMSDAVSEHRDSNGKGMSFPSKKEMVGALKQSIGEDALQREIGFSALDVPTIRSATNRMEHAIGGVALIEGFDEREDGCTAEDAKEMLTAGFPEAWINSFSVSSIKGGVPAESEQAFDGGHRISGGERRQSAKIGINGRGFLSSFDTIRHMVAHANDWSRANGLSPEDRLKLLYAATARVTDPKHIPYLSVGMPSVETDPASVLLNAKEYWACLMHGALSAEGAFDETSWERKVEEGMFEVCLGGADVDIDPERFKPDIDLMKWYFGRLDPDFHPWSAANQVEQIRGGIEERRLLEFARPALDALGEARLAVIMRRAVLARGYDAEGVDVPARLEGELPSHLFGIFERGVDVMRAFTNVVLKEHPKNVELEQRALGFAREIEHLSPDDQKTLIHALERTAQLSLRPDREQSL